MQDTTYLTNVEQPPELIGSMPPIPYPGLAQRAGLQGTVWLDVFINEKGVVDKAIVAKGIGGGCDESAVEVAKNIRFVPAKHRGKPVKARVSIPFRFKLTTVSQGFRFNLDESPVSETELERLLDVLKVNLVRFTYMVPFRHKLKQTFEEYEDGRRTDRNFGSRYSTRDAGKHTLSILVQKMDGNKVQFQFLSPQGSSSISGITLKSYGATKIAGVRNARLAERVKSPILVYAMNPRTLDKAPLQEGTFEYYLTKYKFVIAVVLELEKIE
jgi:protein TonB